MNPKDIKLILLATKEIVQKLSESNYHDEAASFAKAGIMLFLKYNEEKDSCAKN